jgi:hypothetical protein
MKTFARIICAAILLILIGSVTESDADGRYSGHRDGGHGGGHVGVGVWLGPGWWGPNYYPFYYPYFPPEQRIVIEQQPEMYIQPSQQAEEQQIYWYYCTEPKGYYPYVKQCPSGWMKVVPSPPPPSSSPPE